MDANGNSELRKHLGRWISIAIVAAAAVLGLIVLDRTNVYPRTEDAEVSANFIGIAPQVDGPLIRLNVQDNQFVKKGELLYEIDERPYQYALENALSEQAALEGQIVDEQRRIAALVSGVSVASEHPQRGSGREKCRAGSQPGARGMELCEQQFASPRAAFGEAVRHR